MLVKILGTRLYESVSCTSRINDFVINKRALSRQIQVAQKESPIRQKSPNYPLGVCRRTRRLRRFKPKHFECLFVNLRTHISTCAEKPESADSVRTVSK